MQAKIQPFVSESSLRRELSRAKRAGNLVASLMLERALDRIEERRQWRRQRGG
jgi:hypothetical protein